eukprot:Skav225696  [mRNA]  locus=scaffold1817:134198:134413:+ [translate_table: standard]
MWLVLSSTSLWKTRGARTGDRGLKRLFTQIRRWLAPGGVFILEPQPWKAYKKAALPVVMTLLSSKALIMTV